MANEILNPGSQCKASGIYTIVAENGKAIAGVSQRTVIKGEPLPPPAAAGQKYQLAHAAKHKSDLTSYEGLRIYHTGETCEDSGIYEKVSADGTAIEGLEITLIKGEHFPPSNVGGHYVAVRIAKHISELK